MNKSEKLPSRMLGSSGIAVSAIGLGCMSLSGVYGASSDDDGVALIRDALDRGITFLDTSDAYGAGHNETIVGKAIKGRRGEIVLATKFGNLGGRGGKFADGRPEFVIASCEASLKRLGVDVIDLYYQHRIDPDVPIEDTVGAMTRLVQAGKVRALGLSEASPKTIRRAHKVHPIAAVQNEFSLLYRGEADETLRATRELGISFVAYSPLGRGFLTGQIRSTDDLAEGDWRRSNPRFQEDALRENIRLADLVRELAGERGVTPAQLALAWVMAKGDDVVPIPGTKRVSRLDENALAAEIELSAQDLETLQEAFGNAQPTGTRYRESDMALLNH